MRVNPLMLANKKVVLARIADCRIQNPVGKKIYDWYSVTMEVLLPCKIKSRLGSNGGFLHKKRRFMEYLECVSSVVTEACALLSFAKM